MTNSAGSDEAVQLPTVALNTPSARELAGHLAVHRDLLFVRECCERLLVLFGSEDATPDSVLVDALWSTAVIAYARCFKDGRREYRPQPSELAALPLEGEFIEFHELILKLRDKHIAHSVNPFEQVVVGAILSAPGASELKVEGVATLMGRHFVADNIGISQLGHLAHAIAAVVAKKVESIQETVLAETQAMDIDTLSALPPLRIFAPGSESAAQARF